MLRELCIPCTFTRGGFSHERVFHVAAPDGGEYSGVAYIDYCLDDKGERLAEGHPPEGQMASGLLVVREVETLDGGKALIAVPDGETCVVMQSLLSERPCDVPVKSRHSVGN